MTISYTTFSLTGDYEQIILPMPETFSWGESDDVPLYNLSGDNITVRNRGKTDEPLTFNGTYHGYSSPTFKLFEKYLSGVNFASLYLNQYVGQTLTVGIAQEDTYHRISKVSVYLKRSSVYSVSAATVIFVNLKHYLTGDTLSTGTMSAFGISTTGAYYSITMSPAFLLCPNTEYALVFGSTATNSARVYMALHNAGAYSGGLNYYSVDGGSFWVLYAGYDARFAIDGYRDESPYSIFQKIDDLIGEEFTLKGFHNTDIDSTWIISDYSYTASEGEKNTIHWSLSLEKT